jgi:hypothetical protein
MCATATRWRQSNSGADEPMAYVICHMSSSILRCSRSSRVILGDSGCGAAWLARLLGVQEVPGSNPGSPTNPLN